MSNFQVTGDINISGSCKIKKAFKPSLLFLEGNLPDSLLNELYLKLTFINKEVDRIHVPLIDNYAEQMGYGEYVTHHHKLKCTSVSDHTLSMSIHEILENVRVAKNTPIDKNIIQDNSEFLIDFFERALKNIKVKND